MRGSAKSQRFGRITDLSSTRGDYSVATFPPGDTYDSTSPHSARTMRVRVFTSCGGTEGSAGGREEDTEGRRGVLPGEDREPRRVRLLLLARPEGELGRGQGGAGHPLRAAARHADGRHGVPEG